MVAPNKVSPVALVSAFQFNNNNLISGILLSMFSTVTGKDLSYFNDYHIMRTHSPSTLIGLARAFPSISPVKHFLTSYNSFHVVAGSHTGCVTTITKANSHHIMPIITKQLNITSFYHESSKHSDDAIRWALLIRAVHRENDSHFVLQEY
jgi:hypothetical protein